jgi:SagB-type dehydrogenase family enzyme
MNAMTKGFTTTIVFLLVVSVVLNIWMLFDGLSTVGLVPLSSIETKLAQGMAGSDHGGQGSRADNGQPMPAPGSPPNPQGPQANATTSESLVADVVLPKPKLDGKISVEKALNGQKGLVELTGKPLTVAEVGQILWAGQGITQADGANSGSSDFSAFSLSLYVFVINVEGLDQGVYRYNSGEHSLTALKTGDVSKELFRVAGPNQTFLEKASMAVVVASKTEQAGGGAIADNIRMNAYAEAGSITQNMHLLAESLGLGMVQMGGFDKDATNALNGLLGFAPNQSAMYLVPVGRKS